jgi:hypothetical protein
MGDNELPKELLWTNPGGQRGRGRPKSRWNDGVQEGASKLGCRNWRAAAQDRGRWRHCVVTRPRPTQGCRAEDDDDVDDDNDNCDDDDGYDDDCDDDDDDDDDYDYDEVLLAILTSYKHKLVRICAVSEVLTSIKCTKILSAFERIEYR